jgi:capsid portal protein
MSTDVSGLGWDLIDAEHVTEEEPELAPERGEIAPEINLDDQAAAQRRIARLWLDKICSDFQGNDIKLVDWAQMLQMDFESTGNCHAEIIRSPDHKPVGSIHIPARLVRRHRDGKGYIQLNAETRKIAAFFRPFGEEVKPPDQAPWQYLNRDEAAQVSKPVGTLKNELLDFKRYHPAEIHYGIPPLISAMNAVAGNIFSDNRNVRFFINRGLPDWVVTIKADQATFSDPESKIIIDEFQASLEEHMRYLKEGDDYRILTLRLPSGELEVTWEKLNTELKDQDFQVYQTRNRDIIFRVYRMLPARAGIIETASLGSGTGESQNETYKRAQIDPRQQRFENFIDSLLDDMGWRLVRFQFNELDIVDEEREILIYSTASASKAMSLNDKRAWLSRIIRDQDFPPSDEEFANLPDQLLELVVAGTLQQAGIVGPWASGYPIVRQPRVEPLEDGIQALRARVAARATPTAAPGQPPAGPPGAQGTATPGGNGSQRLIGRMNEARNRLSAPAETTAQLLGRA